MPKLKVLYLTDGLLSESDERVLVQALPGLKVYRGWQWRPKGDRTPMMRSATWPPWGSS